MERIFNVKIGDKGQVPIARDIVACANDFGGSVYIEKDGRKISAYSLIGVLSLCIADGDVITVTCRGSDEFAAKLCLERLVRLFADNSILYGMGANWVGEC